MTQLIELKAPKSRFARSPSMLSEMQMLPPLRATFQLAGLSISSSGLRWPSPAGHRSGLLNHWTVWIW